MKRSKINLLLLGMLTITLISFVVLFLKKENKERSPAGITESVRAVDDFLKRFPMLDPNPGLRKALLNYLAKVSKVNNSANSSIEKENNRKLKENLCFAELTADFYSQLRQLDNSVGRDFFTERLQAKGLYDISLAEQSGQGVFNKIKPGTVWEMALEVAGGDGNVAMGIINICGHDNRIQSPAVITDARIVRKFKEHNPFSTVQPSGQAYFPIDCSRFSSLYAPGALGRGIDISTELKNKITAVQAPNKGATSLPAKYYHVLAGAATGCEIKQDSGYNLIGAHLAKESVKYYRSMTLPRGTTAPDRVDALHLWKKWYAPVDIPALRGLWMPIKGKRPEEIRSRQAMASQWMNPNPPSSETFKVKEFTSCDEPQWSKERCRKALAVVDTWEIDFAWTSEQHWIGAKFGEQVCSQFQEGETLESRSCNVLKNKTARPKSPQQRQGVR